MCGIADIELVPACDVAAAPFSKQELDAYAKTLEQPGGADHIFDDRPVASLLLDAKLFEASDRLIVAGPDVAAEEPIEVQLTLARVAAGIGRWCVHDDPGIEATHRRRRRSIVAPAVSPTARSTFRWSLASSTSRNGMRRGRPSSTPNACSRAAAQRPARAPIRQARTAGPPPS